MLNAENINLNRHFKITVVSAITAFGKVPSVGHFMILNCDKRASLTRYHNELNCCFYGTAEEKGKFIEDWSLKVRKF
jgi:hypothetical protein